MASWAKWTPASVEGASCSNKCLQWNFECMRASAADGNKGTGQQMAQDRILGFVCRSITHKGTELILRLCLAQEKQGKCGRRWLREDIRDRSTSVRRRLSYWYGTFEKMMESHQLNKLYKYLLSTVGGFGIQFAHEILFLFPIIVIRLKESYE